MAGADLVEKSAVVRAGLAALDKLATDPELVGLLDRVNLRQQPGDGVPVDPGETFTTEREPEEAGGLRLPAWEEVNEG